MWEKCVDFSNILYLMNTFLLARKGKNMAQNNFILDLIAGLNKTRSKQQIKADVKALGDIYVKLIGNLNMTKTRQYIKNQLKGLNNMIFKMTPTVNTKGVQYAMKQSINTAQKVANNNKIHYSFDMDKKKLQNQLKNFANENSKLFSSKEMTAKYNQLLNLTNVAKSKSELNALRKQLSAFRTELIATNKAGMTWGDKFRTSISHFAQYFSGASVIYAMTNQLRNAWTEAKTLDDSLVDLQKVTSEIADRDALYKYFDKAMSKAQELNVKVGDLIDAITEFKKLGWSLSNAELGAEWATKLANVGDVDIETAIGSIKTSIASFDEIGGYGDDQLDKKLEAYVDLINNMSNKYSIDAEGLAESIRLSAGTLTEAHTSVEQAATMFATANKYYNDPSYLGNTAKIGSLRMRASTGDTSAIEELQEMGEEVDDLAEATSKLREKLLALTGVDIMVDDHTFKSYYDQLYEISQVIDQLDDTSRANVLETMFGKARAASGAAILSGMKESATAYQDAINSAGSATKEYETWMQGADAATQRFSNNLIQTYQQFINGNTVRDLANFGSAILEFANKFGIIEGTLKGFLALKIGTFLTNATMAFLSATKQVEQYGKALQMVNNIPNGNLSQRFTTLKSIAQATSTLTTAQLKQVLSNQALTQSDRTRILMMQGMTKEMALQKLAEMNLTSATNAQTAANVAQTASTFSLKSAMIGLGTTIKSLFLSNPIGISLMAISIGVSAVTSAVSSYNQKMDEAVKSASEAGSEVDNATKSIGEQIEKVKELREQLENSSITQEEAKNIKQELLGIQDSLVEKYGKEAESINLVNGNLKEQIGLLEELSDAELDDYFKDEENRKGIKESTKRMTDKKTYNLGNISSGGNAYDIVSDIVKDFKDKGVEFAGGSNGMSAGFTIKINADAKNAESTISDLMDKLEEAKKGADEETITQIDSLLDSMSKGYSKASNIVEENEANYLRGLSQDMRSMGNDSGDPYDIYRQYAKSIDEYNEALASGKGIDKAKANYETLKQSVDSVLKKYEQFKPLFDQLEESLSEHDAKVYDFSSKFEDKSNSKLKKYADEIKSLGLQGEDLKTFNPNDNVTEDGEKAFEKLKKSAEDYGISVDELIDILEKFGYIQSEVSGQEVNENTFSLPDTETLKQQISDLNSAIDSIQSAYDTLNSAVEEYNSNGGTLSIDTIQSLLSLSNEYLACLQVENGQLSLNADAMNALAQSKLDEAQATAVTQAMTELQAIANGEAAQSTTNYISGNAALMNSLAQLSGSYEGVAQAAMTAAQAQKLSAFISDASAKDKTATENVMKGLDTKLKLIQSTQNKIKSSGISFSKKSSASKAASKSAEKTMEDIQKEWKEYLDKYLAMYKAELDAGLIDFNTFLNKSRSLLDEFYRDRKISAKDYWDSVKSLYENQLSIYDKVLSAVTRRIEKEVDGIQDIIDGLEEQNDALQKQLDEYDSILSVVDEVYQDEIDRLQDEKDLLSEKISQLQDEADAYDLLRRKEEAIYALRRAQEQRTKKVFNGKEFVYTTDNEAIRDAQQTLQDIETEELINNLEREQEALDVEIEKLEEFKGKWAEITNAYDEEINRQLAIALWGKDYEQIILSNRLSDIISFKNNYISIQDQINDNQSTIDSLEEKKEIYEALKEQWSDISKAYEQSQEDQYASMVLGAQWESDVLSGRIDVLNNFKNQYIAIQQAITNAALEAARAQANAQSIQASSASSGGGGYSGGGSSTNSGNEKVLHLQRFMNQVFGSNLTEDGIMGSKTKKAIKHMQLLIGANQTGVYDKATYDKLKYYVGKTLNKENKELYKLAKSLGIPLYNKGTKNAKKGLAIVAENKPELLEDNNGNVSLVTEPSLIEMEGGETVKGAQETQELLNHDNLVPVKMMELPGINGKTLKLSTDEFMNKVASVMPNYSSMVQSAIQMPRYDFAHVNRDNSTSVSIGEIHLHEVNNVDSFANAIIRELPNKISQKLGK